MSVFLSDKQLSNMDIHRFLSGFPQWSSAYKNHFSNSSKILSPLLESISNGINTVDTIFADVFDSREFGFQDKAYYLPSFGIPSSVISEHGNCEYIGEFGFASLEAFPISKIEQDISIIPEDKSLVEILSINQAFVLDKPAVLYIKANANLAEQCVVILKGYNEKVEYIEETIVISQITPVETNTTFKSITEVISDKPITISTLINLDTIHSYSKRSNVQKRITNTRGEYISPMFVIDNNDIYIHSGDTISNGDAYRFYSEHVPEKLYVNNLLDVIYLNNSKLYASKLSLDYSSISQYNSSVNVNDFIIVDNENTHIGETCYVTIKIDKILNDYPDLNFIRLIAKNNDTILYLDRDLNLTPDKDTWVPLTYGQNYIRFGVEIENNLPYEFIIDIGNHSFAAMTYVNKLTPTEIATDISDILIYNGNLLAKYNDDKYYRINPIRLAYMSHGNNVVFFNKFNNLDVSYD